MAGFLSEMGDTFWIGKRKHYFCDRKLICPWKDQATYDFVWCYIKSNGLMCRQKRYGHALAKRKQFWAHLVLLWSLGILCFFFRLIPQDRKIISKSCGGTIGDASRSFYQYLILFFLRLFLKLNKSRRHCSRMSPPICRHHIFHDTSPYSSMLIYSIYSYSISQARRVTRRIARRDARCRAPNPNARVRLVTCCMMTDCTAHVSRRLRLYWHFYYDFLMKLTWQ